MSVKDLLIWKASAVYKRLKDVFEMSVLHSLSVFFLNVKLKLHVLWFWCKCLKQIALSDWGAFYTFNVCFTEKTFSPLYPKLNVLLLFVMCWNEPFLKTLQSMTSYHDRCSIRGNFAQSLTAALYNYLINYNLNVGFVNDPKMAEKYV